MNRREECLRKANGIVNGQREQSYGTPEDNFKVIAEMWSAYLEADVSAVDVAMMMALLKIARISTGVFKEDSFIDLAGYAACGYEIAEECKTVSENDVDQALWKATLEAYAPASELYAYVESHKWSEEHPQKTLKDEFLEKYPNAQISDKGVPKMCPYDLGYGDSCPDIRFDCVTCWNRSLSEVKEEVKRKVQNEM